VEPAALVHDASPHVEDARAREALARLDRRDEELRSASPERTSAPVKPGVRARFMAAMGHELRSPLNSISGFAQLLEDGSDGPLNEAQRENVVLVRRAATELLTLLTDILDTARIEAGRVRLERQWIAPIEVLTLALSRAKDKPETEELIVDVQVQPGLDPLRVDRERLAQALSNVLRAVARKGARLEARVRSMREGPTSVVRFEVVDRSRAIGEADAARAFDPDPSARPSGRSLALGLAMALARDLVQLHGGDARAEIGGGTSTYAIWVPIDQR
jgi:signal transduction histidine kinase